jgi:hypothetical protein
MFNAMFPNDSQAGDVYTQSTGNSLSGCFDCVFTVHKVLPCLYYAISRGDLSLLLRCGVNKADVSVLSVLQLRSICLL